MKIVKLTSENFKKIKAIEIEPKDNTVIISVKNGQGKTSILDSILVALAGKQKDIIKPIREGESKANIELDLGDFIINRIFTGKTTRLEVVSKDGKKWTSPQKMLDEIVGSLSFDPLEFAGKKEKEQRELLLDLIGINFDELDEKRKQIYNKRHEVGVEGKALTQYTDEEVKEAMEYKDKEMKDIQELYDYKQKLDNQVKEYEEAQNNIPRIKQELYELKDELERLEKIKKPEAGTEILENNIEIALKENKKIELAKTVLSSVEKVEEKSNEYKKLGMEIEDIDKAKKSMLENSSMPIEGLSVSDDGVMYNDLPFSQLCSSEQLKVSLAIAMAMNPELRVIRIMDGSLLDDDNMKVINEMAKDKDFQIFIEKVDSTGKVGFYIEDGEIKTKEVKPVF